MVKGLVLNHGLLARVCLGLIFLYHGLVPKILYLSPDEVQMIQAHHFPIAAEQVALLAGILEILLGLGLMVLRKSFWPPLLALIALVLLLADVALLTPHLLVAAFNPLTTNIAGIALCLIALTDSRSTAHQIRPH